MATALLLARLLPRDKGGLARVLVRGPEALSLVLFTLTDDPTAGTPVVQPVWEGQADAKEVSVFPTALCGPAHQAACVVLRPMCAV